MDDAPVSAEAPATDLVERLRKAKPDEHCNDSLCAEAADTITALRAEVERLTAALEEVRDSGLLWGPTVLHDKTLATVYAALKEDRT